MARESNRLAALTVNRTKKPGLYPDGGGLYLQVALGGSKSWLFRFMLRGKARTMGLGSLTVVSLAEARVKAAEARSLRAAGIDPIKTRDAEITKADLEAAKAITFKNAAEKYIEAHKSGWKSAKHESQWRNTLKTHAYPVLGALPVQGIDVAHVMRVLERIWSKKTETASRVRSRIETVLDWATASGYRLGDNPARWRGHLENLLPKRSKVQKVKHHPALPYEEIGTFMVLLRDREAIAARAMEFTILTAARTGEAIGARWKEIDLEKKEWVIPGERTKGGRKHRVPLSQRAIAIVRKMSKDVNPKNKDFVFPGGKKGKPLSNMAMLTLLGRMKRGDITVHGFRSTFREWAEEQTAFPHEVKESALAHTVRDKVEAAYQRRDLFDKRRKLMDAWAKFCAQNTKRGSNVTNINKLRKAKR
jgi:integrase